MKNYIFVTFIFSSFVQSQIISIPDVIFKTRLLNASTSNTIAKNSFGENIKIDVNNNSEIELSEALQVFELRVERPFSSSNYINTLSGIEYFTNLKFLNCNDNNITNVYLQNLTQLVTLQFANNQLTTLDVSNLINLKYLHVRDNNLNVIQFLNNNVMETIWASNNNLTSLNLTSMPTIKIVMVENNNLNNLNIIGLNNLIDLNCSYNSLSTLNLSTNLQLSWLFCSNNLLTNINVTTLPLKGLDISFNTISNINVTGMPLLEYVTINNTLITTFDGSNCGVLQLFCENNPNLTSINVKNNTFSYSDPDLLFFAFKISNNPMLQSICVDSGEQNNLAYFNYNTSGNVIVYGGNNCNVPLQIMSTESFVNNEAILFPNPVKNELKFSFKNTVLIDNIFIYNTLGQLVKQFNGNQNVINLSDLKTGYYYIEFISDKGKVNKKFIKE